MTTERLRAGLAGRYAIERELGQGGMATVYLAHDIRHDRRVAIKVLRPELSAILGAERFLTEIKTTANLQHPHILSLYDSGEADGLVYYVMPYVEGESLRDRITREHQLPVDEAVRIAREVANALHYAHQHGVVHRDIKPENIMLHGGHAMVADFGIALAVSRSDGGTRMTETGMSLGTPHYMAPEQAMGEREITPKADIYALGCVLYEMLTAEPPFTGATAQAVIARVMTEEPRALTLQRRTIPSHVEAAVRTALEKLPADRFHSAAEFETALSDPTFATRAGAAAPAQGPWAAHPLARPRVLAGLSVTTVLLAALAAWGWFRPAPPRPVIRYSMGLPSTQAMRQGVLGVNIAFSPDGGRMVYVGNGENGAQLFVRDRDRLEATPLPGTTGAFNPFFSPDGDRIAFSVSGTAQLKVVPVTGGPPITLAAPGTGAGGGGAWGSDGWVYFDSPGGLSRIRADGGTPELILPLDSANGEIGHAWPDVLPGGQALILRSRHGLDPNDFEIIAADLKTGQRHVLTKGLMGRYAAPGYLVFVRMDGALLAAPFDPDRLILTGGAVPLLEGVMTKAFGSSDLAISATGALAYVPGPSSAAGGVAELVYVDRDGAVTPLDPPMSYNFSPNRALALSPDGRRLAFDISATQTPNIWIKQLPSGPLSRLTFETVRNARPQWSPDGRFVLFIGSPDDTSPPGVWKRRADGSAPAERVYGLADQGIYEAAFSPDGQWLIYRVTRKGGNRDIEAVRLQGDTTPVPLVAGPYQEDGASLSPDGRWLAYSSNESGVSEVFVRPFPNTALGRWQISTTGGSAPRWSHSGRELFYQSDAGDLMVAPISPGATFAPGTPRALFSLTAGGLITSTVVPLYAVTPDDQRFVMVRLAAVNQTPGEGQLVVVDNWTEELRQKMRAAGR